MKIAYLVYSVKVVGGIGDSIYPTLELVTTDYAEAKKIHSDLTAESRRGDIQEIAWRGNEGETLLSIPYGPYVTGWILRGGK